MMFRQFIQRMGRPTIVASIAALMLAMGATAGSLTPPGAVGSTMHSLANIYDSIASATFDSSGIIANQNGSLMGNLKYIENQMAWASGSNNIWSLTSGNVGIGTTSPAYKLEIGTPGDINLASSGAAYRISGNKVLWIKSPSSNSDTMVGVGAGANLTSGLANTFIGYLAGNIATSSSNNTFIGNNAGQLNRTGSSNLFIGRQAGVNNTYGSNNVFLGGFNAGANNTTGSNNVFIGQIAGQSNSTGVNNTFIGAQAGQASTTGFDNTSLGVFAGQAIGNGNQNTYIGTHAGRNATGNLNTFIGGLTGLAFSTGGANTLLGFGADTTSATASGSVAIGYLAKITASHQLVFGSGTASGSLTDAYFGQGVASVSPEGITFHATGGSGTDNPGAPLRFAGGKATGNALGGSILFQTSDAGGSGSALQSLTTKMTITAAGNVGIASSSPSEKLSVNGNIRVSGGSVWIGDGSGQFGKSPFGLFPNAVEIATTSHGGLYGSGGGISSVYVMLDSGLGGSGDVGRGGAFSAMSSDGNSALISLVEGVSGTATHMGSGTVTNLHGGYFFSSNYNLGTVATMDGVGTQLDNEGGGTVTNGSGVRIYAPFSSTFTNLFGLFIEAQTAGANSWNIYSDGASTRNYFGGNIGVGTTTPNFNIDVNGVLAASVSGNADLVLNNSQNQDGLFRLRSIGGATSSRLDIMGSASAALVSIASTGYVGIGTTAPITQLHVPGLTRPVIKSTTALTNSAKSVYVQGRYAYVTEIGTTGSLQIFDITNPASPTVTASVSLGAQPYAITVQGQYAYVVDASQNNFRILNVSNPARPTVVSTITTGTQPKAVVVQGRYAYVTSQTSNLLQVIDVANPAAPVIVGSVGIGNATNFGLAVQGRYAYIANTSAKTFQIVDVANPAGPTVVRTVATTGTSPLGIAVEGRYAYIAETGGNEIEVFDISDAANAFSVTTFSTGASSGPFSVFIQDHILYVVTNTSSTMQMIDISNPASPVSFGTISTTTGPWNIFVQGRFAYIGATQGKTFQIIDVGGSYIQQLEAGGLDTSTLNVRGNSQMFNNMDIGGGLVIGRGLQVTGPVSFTGSISGAYNPVVFDATGNVGMGTTHVDAKLELVSAATTTNVASISALSLTSGDVFSIVVPASTSTSGRYLLVQDINGQAYASLGNGGRLALRRDITSHGAQAGCTGSGTPTAGCIDYAESYPTTDSTLSAGEIVAVDPHNLFGVIRAEGSASVLGVISTNPAALITGTALLSGANTNQGPAGTVPVALAGRVPVKLSGSVSAGDHLSLSGTPGVAQKATTAGMTVGIALEDSSGPTVLTFVNTSYWAPEIPKLPDAPQSDGLFATIVAWFRDLLGITFEKGKVQANQLCAGTTCVDSAQLQRLLDMVGGSVPPATPAPSDAPSATPLPTDTAEPVTTNSPSPTPSDTVIPTPDTATPTPTPMPEATPDVVSGPTDEPLPTSSP